METLSVLVGAVCGIFSVLLVNVIGKKIAAKKGLKTDGYDERQTFERNKAASIAFFAGLFYFLLAGMYFFCEETTVTTAGIITMAGVCLMAVLYSSICIWKDAYNYKNQQPEKGLACIFIIGAVFAILALVQFKKMNNRFWILFAFTAVIFLSLFVNLGLKKIADICRTKAEQKKE